MEDRMNKMVSTKELAEMFNVTAQTIWRWRVRGMPHIKINSTLIRYNLDEVMDWINSNQK